MSTRTYPLETANPNVPKDVFLIAEESYTSGELVTTWYVDRERTIWKVDDWKMSKPIPVALFSACRKTGDTEQVLNFRYESWLEQYA